MDLKVAEEQKVQAHPFLRLSPQSINSGTDLLPERRNELSVQYPTRARPAPNAPMHREG